MSNMDKIIKDALGQLNTQSQVSGARPVISPSETALYRYCQLVVEEVQAWQDNAYTYSDEINALHRETIKLLVLKIEESEDTIKVSYELKKE